MQIDTQFIESLLFESESDTLDFKSGQYPFSGATDDDKSELLKDILAFANAFARTDGFILIGVQHIPGARSQVVGVSNQIDDAHLQQFINGKVQRPLRFSYKAMQHDGLPIAVIHIPRQQRPFYSKVNFGKVGKGAVYFRRGSSTAVATPDEIARMGAADQPTVGPAEPKLEASLLDQRTGESLGLSANVKSVVVDRPSKADIPDYREESGQFQISLGSINSDFHRNVGDFLYFFNLVQPLALSITNSGDVTATDVRLVIELRDPEDIYWLQEKRDLPKARRRSDFAGLMSPALNMPMDRSISIAKNGDVWRVDCEFGKIQPKDAVRLSDDLYLGAVKTCSATAEFKIFADNLSHPVVSGFTLNFEAEPVTVSVDEIVSFDFENIRSARQKLGIIENENESDDDE